MSTDDRRHEKREYLSELPEVIPVGHVLVHNLVEPAPLGANNQFRAWLERDFCIEREPVRGV